MQEASTSRQDIPITHTATLSTHGATPIPSRLNGGKDIFNRFPYISALVKAAGSAPRPAPTPRVAPDVILSSGQRPQSEHAAWATNTGALTLVSQTPAVGAASCNSVPAFVPIILLLLFVILWAVAMVIYLIVTRVRPRSPSGLDYSANVREKKARRKDSVMADFETQDLHNLRSRYTSARRRHSNESDVESASATGLSTAMEWPQTTVSSSQSGTGGSSAIRRLIPSGAVQTEEEWLRRRQRFEESSADEESLLSHTQSNRRHGTTAVERLSKFLGLCITRTMGRSGNRKDGSGGSTKHFQGYNSWGRTFLDGMMGWLTGLRKSL